MGEHAQVTGIYIWVWNVALSFPTLASLAQDPPTPSVYFHNILEPGNFGIISRALFMAALIFKSNTKTETNMILIFKPHTAHGVLRLHHLEVYTITQITSADYDYCL